MSEQQTETEFVQGTITGIVQKAADKWQVAVQIEGSQYAKNLWTKDPALIAALSMKIGQHGVFACGISHWTNNQGAPVKSLWINEVQGQAPTQYAPGGNVPQGQASAPNAQVSVQQTPAWAPPAAQAAAPASDDGMTPAKWDAKERRDYRSRAWAQTLGAFTHTIKVDEDPMEVFTRLKPFQYAVFSDVCGMFAQPDQADDDQIPF